MPKCQSMLGGRDELVHASAYVMTNFSREACWDRRCFVCSITVPEKWGGANIIVSAQDGGNYSEVECF